jgi:hypothetical protein
LATKISITKKLEGQIRDAIRTSGGPLEIGYATWDALHDVVRLIDAAHSSKASGSESGLASAPFLKAVMEHRPVVLPPPGPIGNAAYGRLSKCLEVNGVTLEQATALGVWLAGPGMKAAPGEITIDRIIKNLGDWITRAVANKPEYQRPEW